MYSNAEYEARVALKRYGRARRAQQGKMRLQRSYCTLRAYTPPKLGYCRLQKKLTIGVDTESEAVDFLHYHKTSNDPGGKATGTEETLRGGPSRFHRRHGANRASRRARITRWTVFRCSANKRNANGLKWTPTVFPTKGRALTRGIRLDENTQN